jgi:hypothetical protein
MNTEKRSDMPASAIMCFLVKHVMEERPKGKGKNEEKVKTSIRMRGIIENETR